MVLLVTILCSVGEEEGMINLAFPYTTIGPIRKLLKLSAVTGHQGNTIETPADFNTYRRFVDFYNVLPHITHPEISKIEPGTSLNVNSTKHGVYKYTNK
jgi:hypothetical protein